MNTTGAASDGIFEFWLDGALFSNCAVGSNHNDPQNGGVDFHVDFDDIAISTTGYIGPTYGTPSAGPRIAAPKNLRVQ